MTILKSTRKLAEFFLFVQSRHKVVIMLFSLLTFCFFRSQSITTQFEAFELIFKNFVKHPSKVRYAFRSVFESFHAISDVVTFSWRRPGVEYSAEWLVWYKLASRSLSSRQNLFFEAAAQFDGASHCTLDFSHFEELLLNCR